MNLFSELKRRNVFRVGIAYAVAAWVMLQIADLVLDNITAPDWVMQVFMLALAIGFPITLIMAWAFEMTPEGLKRETDVDRSQSITPQTGRKLDRAIIVLLALAVVFLIIDPFDKSEEPARSATTVEPVPATPAEETAAPLEKSVAVLPFAFRSNNPDDEFFAEGMHDDLLTQLAKIGSLKVISRTSVMEYRDTTKKIPEIAAELGVATIVEGGVQRSGSRMRFNAQLINAQTDEHLWAETYDRELTAENLFDIQAEIAKAIANALQATLSPQEEARIGRALTSNLNAWESYQRAMFHRRSQTVQGINSGITEIDRALELDPKFAAAWGLKATLLLLKYWFYDTDIATRDGAWDAIQRGREIDPDLGELDLAEAYYHYWGFRDYEKALSLVDKAAKSLPNSSLVHQARAFILRRMGDWEGTLAAMNTVTELDPWDTANLSDTGFTLTVLRRFDEAKPAFDKALESDSNDPANAWRMSEFYLQAYGDVAQNAYLTHLTVPANPLNQWYTWNSALYIDDFETALNDVAAWQERFLETKDFRVSKPMLNGLTHLYAGDLEKARPLLISSKQAFEEMLQEKAADYAVVRSLCLISGGLGDKANADKFCHYALELAPRDAFVAGIVKFDAAAGLALAGDATGAAQLLKAMLDGDAGPTMYQVMYHPAFDGIREHEAYIELLEQYGPEATRP